MISKKTLRLILFLSLCLLLTLPFSSCKKSPLSPDSEALTRPLIWVNASEVSFTALESGGNPPPQTLTIKNSGPKTLNYSISDNVDWLAVEPSDGSSSGQLVEHTIIINRSGLSLQNAPYSATIVISCSDAYNNPQKVGVCLNMTKEQGPLIWASPPQFVLNTQIGSNPPPQTLKIRNSGKGNLTYTIASDSSWLTVSPAAGTSDGEENLHSVQVSASGLSTGTYSGMITIADPGASNSPQQVYVMLGINTVPTGNEIRITASPSSGRTNSSVTVSISIIGNSNEISVFGLDLAFDSNLFQYQGISSGSLTGTWAMVDGNIVSPGVLRIGGFAGSGTLISPGRSGTIATITFKVTGTGFSDGQQSQLSISAYADDIAGMKPEPASTIFTYRK